ncbi:MAG: molybdopterin cofactor-binding domain-containing protein, partial [Candidatus Hydrogenedentota bacterium]
MNPIYDIEAGHEPERYELFEQPRYQFRHTRRTFIQIVSTGILITWTAKPGYAQRVESGEEAPHGSRFHIGKDGRITAMTGKVEMGQGARAQITQAVAEEFHVPVDQVQLVMADTDLVPNDGPSHGSRTTPSTIPRVRGSAAAARDALILLACKRWGVDPSGAHIENGVITHTSGKKTTLAELAASGEGIEGVFGTETSASDRSSTEDWTVLGTAVLRPNARNVATGAHRYPSDIKRPGMLYGKILRPPAVGAKLVSVDIGAAKTLEGVSAVHDGDFVGCAAPTRLQAAKAVDAIAKTAIWSDAPTSSSETLFAVLKEKSQAASGRGRSRDRIEGDVDAALSAAKTVLRAAYEIPYIQHAPMEPRAATAEWDEGRLTVWTDTQQPFGVRGDVARAFGLREDQVRIIAPDFGGGFGGKQDPEVAIEAARLAKEAGKPVAVHWTREEEFSWAYCRPAGLVEVAAGIADDGSISAWDFTNYNSGGSGIDCPYTVPNKRIQFRPS